MLGQSISGASQVRLEGFDAAQEAQVVRGAVGLGQAIVGASAPLNGDLHEHERAELE